MPKLRRRLWVLLPVGLVAVIAGGVTVWAVVLDRAEDSPEDVSTLYRAYSQAKDAFLRKPQSQERTRQLRDWRSRFETSLAETGDREYPRDPQAPAVALLACADLSFELHELEVGKDYLLQATRHPKIAPGDRARCWRTLAQFSTTLKQKLKYYDRFAAERSALEGSAAVMNQWLRTNNYPDAHYAVAGDQAIETYAVPLWKAKALHDAGRYDEALEYYIEYLSLPAEVLEHRVLKRGLNSVTQTHWNMANCYRQAGKMTEAIEMYQSVMDDPEHKGYPTRSRLGWLIAMCRHISDDPGHGMGKSKTGVRFRGGLAFAGEVEAFLKDAPPDSATNDIYLELGWTYWKRGRHRKALSIHERVLREELVTPRHRDGSALAAKWNNARHSRGLSNLATSYLLLGGIQNPDREGRALALETAVDYFDQWIEWNERHLGDDESFGRLSQRYKQLRDRAQAEAAKIRQYGRQVTP